MSTPTSKELSIEQTAEFLGLSPFEVCQVQVGDKFKSKDITDPDSYTFLWIHPFYPKVAIFDATSPPDFAKKRKVRKNFYEIIPLKPYPVEIE